MTHPTQWPFFPCFFLMPTDISSRPSHPVTRARCSLAPSPSLSERRWRRQPIGWRFAGWVMSQSHSNIIPSSSSLFLLLIYRPPACIRHKWATCNARMVLQLDVGEIISNVYFLFQDQLSADMYSFVAKEIDYANYFQTVSIFGKIRVNVVFFIYFLQIKLFSPF